MQVLPVLRILVGAQCLACLCVAAKVDPFRPARGSTAPLTVNGIQSVLRGEDAEKVVKRCLRQLSSEAREAAASSTAFDAEGENEDRRRVSKAIYGVSIFRRRLGRVLEAACAHDGAEWVAKYGEEGRFGLPLAEMDNPLVLLERAKCFLALYLLGAHTDAVLSQDNAPELDFIDDEVAEVLSAPLDDVVRALREGLDGSLAKVADYYSLSDSFVADMVGAYGADCAEAFFETCNKPGPMVVRTNALRGSRAAVLEQLAADGIAGESSSESPYAVTLADDRPRRPSLFDMEAWRSGAFEVQAESSQLCCLATRAAPGDDVLDYCAGRGGKALMLAAMVGKGGLVVAADDGDELALKQIPASAARAGAEGIVRTDPYGNVRRKVGTFDAVLCDAPCSSSGTIRRHPGLRWQLEQRQEEVPAASQLRILEGAAASVKAGGTLVYATCSVLEEENSGVADGFLRGEVGGDFEPFPFDGGDEGFGWAPVRLQEHLGEAIGGRFRPRRHELLLLPSVHGRSFDGFYMCRFRRRREGKADE